MSRTGIFKNSPFKIIAALLVTVFWIGSGVIPIQAQSFDHESYPQLDFDFVSLDLELGLQPQNLRIDGAATYQVKANVSGADTLTLYAAHMDISSVSVDGTGADFMLQNDSLFVPVGESAEAGQEFEVRIRYSANPQFGLLKNVHNTVRSSLLPKSQRHWVPIVDNPHVDLKTTFTISVPSGYQVWATGQNTDRETVSVDVMRFRFESEEEVPASSLALAVGRFDTESAKGEPNVQVAVEQALSDTINTEQLLQKAQDYLEQVSDSLQVDYPHNQLTVLVMDDHQWETKSWTASAVYLYKNRGDLDTQLLRGIIGQWFGVQQREAQWNQADAITLQQVVSFHSIADSIVTLKEQDTLRSSVESIYDGFGIKNWNRWIEGWASWEKENLKSVIKEAQTDALQELPSVVSWDDYAKLWYRNSGQRLFEIPEFNAIEGADATNSSTENADSVAYKVTYDYNEVEGQLTLSFEAEYGVYGELTSINAYEVYPNSTDTTEVTFTGPKDSVVLQVDPTISTMYLEAPDRPGLYLDEFKPSSFLISELRNAEDVERRAAAARKLGAHTDNPDLQLAIRDFMNRNLEPDVEAALLSSYADITAGASGTEETFLDALESNKRAIREAGLMALQNFEGNSKVMNQVEQLALNAEEDEFFKKATQVLVAISSPEQFETYAEDITQQDKAGRSIFTIQQLANIGEVEAAVEKADLFTSDSYSYSIRSMALEILIQHDHAPANWLTRAEELLESSDPRIRYLVISGLARQEGDEVRNFLSEYRQDEYDERVYQRIMRNSDE